MPTVLCPPLLPLWVRCDMSDALGTTWLGAETVSAGNKVSGIKLYTICSKGNELLWPTTPISSVQLRLHIVTFTYN